MPPFTRSQQALLRAHAGGRPLAWGPGHLSSRFREDSDKPRGPLGKLVRECSPEFARGSQSLTVVSLGRAQSRWDTDRGPPFKFWELRGGSLGPRLGVGDVYTSEPQAAQGTALLCESGSRSGNFNYY